MHVCIMVDMNNGAHPECPVCSGRGALDGVDLNYGETFTCEACGGFGRIFECHDCSAPFADDDELHEARTGIFVCGRCARDGRDTVVPPAPPTIPAPAVKGTHWECSCGATHFVEEWPGARTHDVQCGCSRRMRQVPAPANDMSLEPYEDSEILGALTNTALLAEAAREAGIPMHEAARLVRKAVGR